MQLKPNNEGKLKSMVSVKTDPRMLATFGLTSAILFGEIPLLYSTRRQWFEHLLCEILFKRQILPRY